MLFTLTIGNIKLSMHLDYIDISGMIKYTVPEEFYQFKWIFSLQGEQNQRIYIY